MTTDNLIWFAWTGDTCTGDTTIKTSQILTVTGEWQRLLFNHNGTHTSFYKNGTLQGSPTATDCWWDDIQGALVGNRYRLGDYDTGNAWDGEIDEYTFWDAPLNATDIAEDYNNGVGYDYTFIPGINFTITSSDIFNSSSINVFNATIDGVFYNTTTGTITANFTDGRLSNVTLNAENYFSRTYIEYNTSSSLSASLTYYKPIFSIKEKIRTFFGNTTITDFNLSFYNMNTSSIETEVNTTTGNITAELTWNNTYNITIDVGGYELAYITHLANQSLNYPNYVYLYTTNSIQIYILDEKTNTNLTENVSITFIQDATEFTKYTFNGSFYIDNLLSGEWQLFIGAENNTAYSPRAYTITVNNRSHQELYTYLVTNTSTTTFTVSNKDTGEYLEDVLVTMYRSINGTWTAVESKYTDITGNVQLQYQENVQYKFFLGKTDYVDYVFYLAPVLYSEYAIQMERTTVYEISQDLDKIAVIYAPTSFTQGINNFNWIIQSPYGELIDYGYTLTYPGGTNTTSGNNAIGGQLGINFNITGADIWDQVILEYYYTTSLAGTRTFTLPFPISNPDLGNNTMAKNKDNTYGLGIFERIFIATLIVIFVVGISALMGQVHAGLGLGIMVYGLLVYNGFVPIWSVVISMVLGVWFLSMEAT